MKPSAIPSAARKNGLPSRLDGLELHPPEAPSSVAAVSPEEEADPPGDGAPDVPDVPLVPEDEDAPLVPEEEEEEDDDAAEPSAAAEPSVLPSEDPSFASAPPASSPASRGGGGGGGGAASTSTLTGEDVFVLPAVSVISAVNVWGPAARFEAVTAHGAPVRSSRNAAPS